MKVLESVRILIVEDEAMLLETLAYLIGRSGAIVSTATSGVDALKLAQDTSFDVIVTDIRMPGGNGIDLIRNLAQLPPPHPLFFTCSGYSDLNEIQAIRNLVAGQFEKPFRSTAVIAEIRKALDSKTAI